MRDIFKQLVDYALTFAIIFLVPLIYFGQKKDILIETLASEITISFGDEIRGKGYLSKEMYNNFIADLSKTGLLYEVDMKHRHSVYEPEYRMRSVDEIVEEQDNSYSGENVYTYRPVTTEIPIVNDPVDNGSLNTETNESVLAKAVNNSASPSHMHTDACYNGSKHIHTGNSSSGGGCYGGITTIQVKCNQTRARAIQASVYKCNKCGREITGSASDGKPCSTMDGGIYVYSHQTSITYVCLGCDIAKPALDNNPPCSNMINRSAYTLNCGKTEGAYYNGNAQVFPICNQLITSITATHPVQTVTLGDPLITTITANYLDGSTKVVVATTTFSTNTIVQNAQATLTYIYTIGVPYSKSCNITVTVIPRSKTCANGHTYNLKTDGRDPGCPYCKSWLSSLSILNPTSGNMTIYKGTTLSENGVTLLATYMDGHTEYLYNEYIDNLDIQYVGIQNVTLSYKGKYVHLTVITKRNQIKCSTCSRYYELYPDGSNPGCPYCLSRTPIFTGNVLQYESEFYENGILNELYEGSGTYYFSDRDSIVINVRNTVASMSQNLLRYIYKGLGENNIQITDSGYIREDGSRMK